MKNTKNMRRGTREKHERTLNQQEQSHTCARSKKHKEINGPDPTKDDTSGGRSSPRGGLESTRDLPIKGS